MICYIPSRQHGTNLPTETEGSDEKTRNAFGGFPTLLGYLGPNVVGGRGSLSVRFINIAKQAGIDFFCIFGGLETKKYIIETTGSGVAFLDFDRDGWQDLYFVTGTLLEGHGKTKLPRTGSTGTTGMGPSGMLPSKPG